MNGENITNIIISIAAIITSATAVFGLNEWKKQIRGKASYETSRRCIKVTLQLRDAVKFVRNPFISVDEMYDALEKNGIELKGKNIQDIEDVDRYVYSERWKEVSKSMTNFEAEMLEAEVLFGESVIQIQNNFKELISELFLSIKSHLGSSDRNNNLIYDLGEQDEFSKKINVAVDDSKSYFKPCLK